MTPLEATDIERTLLRTNKARAMPYTSGIWEGRRFNRKPFITIRASDYDAIVAQLLETATRVKVLEECLAETRRLVVECVPSGFTDENAVMALYQNNGAISALVPPPARTALTASEDDRG